MDNVGKLMVHGREVNNVFELLGDEENDITYSLGWVLSRVNPFLKKFIEKICGQNYPIKDTTVRLQEYGKKGITDIELLIPDELFCIIETKKGWNLPTKNQLKKYLSRFKDYPSHDHKLVVVSECKKEYAEKELKKYKLRLPVGFVSWEGIYRIIRKARARCGHHDQKVLNELESYFKKVISTRDTNSNMVYCVVLSSETPEGSRLSWVDIVRKEKKYFYPAGKHWPKEPPNYMAFRYHGELMSIHHVDGYEIIPWSQMRRFLPINWKNGENKAFLLKLGHSFRPEKQVKNGNIYPKARVWCMLDTLFTCRTIEEAVKLTKKRTSSF